MLEVTDVLNTADVIEMGLEWPEVFKLYNQGKITSNTLIDLLDWYNLR